VKRFVYNQKYAKLLVAMKGKKSQIEKLAKDHDINAGHLRTVMDQWQKEDVITRTKDGREYKFSLSKKGELISQTLAELMHIEKYGELPEKKEVKDSKPQQPANPTGENK